MKGLIIKDLLQLKSYKRTLMMFIMVFVFTSLTQENIEAIGNMFTIMMIFGFGMFVLTTFNYDEQAKADRYILTFPLTKKEIVLSKFILIGIANIIGAIMGILGSTIITYLMNQQLPNISELILTAFGGILGLGIVEGIQVTCIYKYGVEKGRIQVFIVFGIIALLLVGIFLALDKMNIQLPDNNSLNFSSNFLPIILILLIAIVYVVFYKIAYHVYAHKEV